MTRLWVLLGVVVGANTVPIGSNVIGVVSGAIAGVLLLPWLGIVLGLLGGRVWETACGGGGGLLVGAGLAALSGQVPVQSLANVGLLGGAMAGATAPALARHLRQFLELVATRPVAESAGNPVMRLR
jgi:hypothetical protein